MLTVGKVPCFKKAVGASSIVIGIVPPATGEVEMSGYSFEIAQGVKTKLRTGRHETRKARVVRRGWILVSGCRQEPLDVDKIAIGS